MKERLVDGGGAIPSHDQAAEVAESGDGSLHDPTVAVAAQRATVLRGRTDATAAVRRNQFDAPALQSLPQRIAVIGFVGDHSLRLLTGSAARRNPDRGERLLGEFDFRRGGRVQVLSQRNTAPSTTTIHFVPLPRLVLPTLSPPFWPEQNYRPRRIRSTSVAGAR